MNDYSVKDIIKKAEFVLRFDFLPWPDGIVVLRTTEPHTETEIRGIINDYYVLISAEAEKTRGEPEYTVNKILDHVCSEKGWSWFEIDNEPIVFDHILRWI